MRVLIHPGFHKTGTSSLQFGAEKLRDRPDSPLRVMLTNDLRDAVKIARRYSAHPDEARLAAFAKAFAACTETIDPADPRPLLMSSEALIGLIPGRKNVSTYEAAPALLMTVVEVLKKRLGTNAEITIWFTTRNAADWQRSAYWQNLRSTRLTEDFETYKSQLEDAAQLGKIVFLTRSRLSGSARVISTRIEDCGNFALGPLGVALELLDISMQDLGTVGTLETLNTQPQGGAEMLLELNRSSLDDGAVSDAKRELLRQYRKFKAFRN